MLQKRHVLVGTIVIAWCVLTTARASVQLDASTNITIETRGELADTGPITTDLLQRNLLAALGRTTLQGDGPTVRFILEADAPMWADLVGKIDRLTQTDAYTVTIADDPATVTLHGRTAMGCSFAVTDFLEHNLGVMWFMPGELGLCLPSRQTFTLTPGSRTAEPAVASRIYTGLQMNNPALNRFGYEGLHHRQGYYFRSRDAIKAYRLHHLTFASHALVRVFDVNEFGKSDPDLYPLIDGKRWVPPTDRSARYYQNWHICFTNPKAVDIAVRKAKEYFAADGGQTFSLGINDGVNHKCHCDSCATVGIAQSYFDFVNAVARRVRADYPLPYMIGVLGYGDMGVPTEGLQLEDNVLVLGGPGYFEGHASNLGAYEYLYGWGFWVPNFPLHTMKQNALRYRDMGVSALHAEVHPVWAFDAPKVYLRSRLLWDPDLDVDAALAHFCDAAFGKGGPAMTRFYQRWAALTDKHLPGADPAPMVDIRAFRRSEVQFSRVSAEDYAFAYERLAEARNATGDALIHRRFDMIEAFIDYSKTLLDMWQNKNRIFASDGDMRDLHTQTVALGERRQTILDTLRKTPAWFTGTNQTVDRILSDQWEGRWEWTLDYEHDCALRTAAVALRSDAHIEPRHLTRFDLYHKQYNQDIYAPMMRRAADDAVRFSADGEGKRYLRGAFAITQGEQYAAEFDVTAAGGELVIHLHNMNVCGKTATITETIGPETQTLRRRIILKPVPTWGDGDGRRVTELDVEILWHPRSADARLEGAARFGQVVIGAAPVKEKETPQTQPAPAGDNFDFEVGPAGEASRGKLPPHWDRAYSSLAGVEIIEAARPDSKGKQALKLALADGLNATGMYSPMLAIDDDKPLTVSIWLRDDGDPEDKRRPHIAIHWFDAKRQPVVVMPDTKVNYLYLPMANVRTWQQVQKTLTPAPSAEAFNRYENIPQGAAFFSLRLNLQQYPGPVVFDDFTYQQGKPDTAAAAPRAKMKSYAVAWLGETSKGNRYGPKYAAEELAGYMTKVLGRDVPATSWADAPADRQIILVTHAGEVGGDTARDLAGKRRDAFVIRQPYMHDGRDVCLLASADEYACDYPAYHLLRKYMDVHWVGPGEVGEVIPDSPDWTLPARIADLENPDFEMRLWADRGFKMARPILAGSSRMGFHHALGVIFHPDKHGDKPEVYPLVDGERYIPSERTQPGRMTSGWQPCISHPTSIEIATNYVLDTLASGRAISASLSVNDGSSNWCECDGCKALSPDIGERFYKFYNTVTERVVAKNPEAYIAALAYGPCQQPPKETRIHDRIVIFVTGGDPLRFGDPRRTGGKRAVYHYHLDNAYPTVRHYPHLLADYVRTIHEHGGIAMYTQIEHSWAAGGPKTYLLAHLLWDVDTDVDATLDRYINLTFGEQAAPAMSEYFDRWEAIFNRETREGHFNTIEAWTSNHLHKHEQVTWDDLTVLDGAIARAAAASKTDKQAARFAYFQTYYYWARANLAQYLLARDMGDSQWLAARNADQILDAAARAVALTEEFDQRWERDIATDRTGWLLNARTYDAVEKGMRFYDSLLVGPIRTAVEGYLAEAIDAAVAGIADGRDDAVAYLRAQAAKRPTLQTYIGPVADRFAGIERPNVLANASFEVGTHVEGEPPRLDGWWFYDRVGMVKGATAQYDWKDDPDRGGKVLGFGPGKFPGVRTFMTLEPGRYQLSFWFRTVNRDSSVTVNLLRMDPQYSAADFETESRVREISMVNDAFIKFLAHRHPPTDGKWQRVVQQIEVRKAGVYCLMLEPFGMADDAWAWFDDLQIRAVWTNSTLH